MLDAANGWDITLLNSSYGTREKERWIPALSSPGVANSIRAAGVPSIGLLEAFKYLCLRKGSFHNGANMRRPSPRRRWYGLSCRYVLFHHHDHS